MIIEGSRSFWLARSIVGVIATLLVGSLSIYAPQKTWWIMALAACVIACGTFAEFIRALMPYKLHLMPVGLLLSTPFRRRFWGWDSYEGVVRVAAPLGEKPLMLATRTADGKRHLTAIGKWPLALESEIQAYARNLGVHVPAVANAF